jgi:G3E family GTPase
VATKATPRHTEQFGIVSFVFQARRPFERAKLDALLARGIAGLLRAKGFFWLVERPDEMGFLSVAGGVARTDFPSYWWAAMIENGKARRSELPTTLEKLWEQPGGDRRQELVFIGVGLDEKALRRELEQCLVK